MPLLLRLLLLLLLPSSSDEGFKQIAKENRPALGLVFGGMPILG